MLKVEEKWLEAAVLGGAILGGGGGGSLEEGQRLGKLALELGAPTILDINQLPAESLILTVSAVGAPSMNQHPLPSHYVKAVQFMSKHIGEIRGLITNEIGGLAVINGLVPSALLDIPLVDAACNGRAHPTGAMGSMGLSMNDEFISHQVAVGRVREDNKYIEIYAQGNLSTVSKVIRKAAEESGGTLAVTRNPVPAQYIRDNAALGALSQAVQIGQAYLDGKTGRERIEKVVRVLNGEIVAEGNVDSVELLSQGGFDLGIVRMGEIELAFWNEYMTLEEKGNRLATFPDLIMTMETDTGKPLTTAEINNGQEITVVMASRDNLNLGAGMRDPKLFHDIEKVLNKEIIKYVFSKE